jgi:hypothetical protein
MVHRGGAEDAEARVFVKEHSELCVLSVSFENYGSGKAMRLPIVTPNVLIGGPVRIPPGFPLQACGNDGLSENSVKPMTCSIFILWGRA